MKISNYMEFIITLFSISGVSVSAWANVADADSSGYFGARVGYSYNEKSCMNTMINCDKTDTGYGLFAGYDFNQRFAVEFSFNDIGDSSAKYPTVNLNGELHEVDIALKLTHNIYKQTRLYGKIGAAYWDGKVTGGSAELSDSGLRPLLGAGVEFPISDHWLTRLEYQYIDQVGNDLMGRTNPHFFGIALVWNFASRAKTPVISAALIVPAVPSVVETPPQLVPTPIPAVEIKPIPERHIVVDEQHGGPLFEFDKAEIRNTAAIDPVVEVLLQSPTLNVTIIGHTDARGSSDYNQRLSETRANVVAKYLHAKGVALDRIKVFGMGEDQPINENETESGRAKNRRVEFVISGSQALHSSSTELKGNAPL